ncbi:MAG: hypothetical protein ACKVZH_21750 [Blastocatellia bacterium]
MKLYRSFLIRCWLIPGSGQQPEDKIVFDIEHIQKGEHARATNPAEAIEWLANALRAEQAQMNEVGDDDDASSSPIEIPNLADDSKPRM